MSQNNNQQDQSKVIGEMFNAANVAQSVPSPPEEKRSFTVDNVQQPTSLPPAQNGLTIENIRQPEPAEESEDE